MKLQLGLRAAAIAILLSQVGWAAVQKEDAPGRTQSRAAQSSGAGVEAFKASKVIITLEAEPNDEASIEWLNDSDDQVSIKIPKSFKPVLKIPRNIEMFRSVDKDSIILSFAVQPGTKPGVQWKANVLEIVLVAATTASGQGAGTVEEKPASTVTETEMPAREVFTAPTSPPANTAIAQPVTSAGPVQNGDVDLSVPDSPAFTVLDLTPNTVVQPSSPKQLVTSLLSGVDRNGNFQSGIALDTVPYLLFFGDKLTLEEYQASYPTRLIARTQLSIATTRGASSADKSARLALGFRATLWDDSDPRSDPEIISCLKKGLAQANLELGPLPPGMSDQDLAAKKQEAAQKAAPIISSCRNTIKQRRWNNSSLTIGAAPSWISLDGNVRDLRWNGGAFWTSLAYGFDGISGLEDMFQAILHARYRTNEQVPDPNVQGNFLIQDSTLFGVLLKGGTPDFAFTGEYIYANNKPQGMMSDRTFRLSFGAERKVATNLWFSVSVGGDGGRTGGKNNNFVLTSFKWNFSKDPVIPLPPR